MLDPVDPELLALERRVPVTADLGSCVETANRLVVEWGVAVEGVLPGANYGLLVAGRNPQGEVVLRVPLGTDDGASSGYFAQMAFSGNGGVEILAGEPTSHSLLMRRIRPGTMLLDAKLSPIEEVEACCSVIRRLRRDPIAEAPSLGAWYEPFLAASESEWIPHEMLREAQKTAAELLRTTEEKILLHGDLHHYNLLRDGEDWISIDAQGVIGDPCVEPAAFIRNPLDILDMGDVEGLVALRVRAFADRLGYPVVRLWAWAFAHNVLSAWWCEGEERRQGVRVVEAIRAARP